MKAIAATELLLLVVLCGLAYMVWMQQAQLVDLELHVDRLDGKIEAAKPKPRTPKPKETPK